MPTKILELADVGVIRLNCFGACRQKIEKARKGLLYELDDAEKNLRFKVPSQQMQPVSGGYCDV